MEKTYLGDGVYVASENGMFRLTAENGIAATDVIYLEPEVYRNLRRHADKALGLVDAPRTEESRG